MAGEPPAHSRWAYMREERLRCGYATVKDLAQVTGIGTQRLKALEGGSMRPLSMTELHALAVAGFDINYVLTGTRAVKQALPPDEAALLDNYRAASPARQTSLREVGAAFAQPLMVDRHVADQE